MYDVAIIGCGVIGAAAAYALSRYDNKVVILEAENDVADCTTKANSAILHAGYDPAPGTRMARLNVRGVALAKEICAKLDVSYKQCGSLVLALDEKEQPHLQHLFENGTGAITINGRDIDEYFGLDTLKLIVRQPLVTTDLLGKVDIVVTVAGGGVSGQAGAIRHGISRALVTLNPEYRASLTAAGFMTRDPRMKERKKPGLKKARRAPQFSKR